MVVIVSYGSWVYLSYSSYECTVLTCSIPLWLIQLSSHAKDAKVVLGTNGLSRLQVQGLQLALPQDWLASWCFFTWGMLYFFRYLRDQVPIELLIDPVFETTLSWTPHALKKCWVLAPLDSLAGLGRWGRRVGWLVLRVIFLEWYGTCSGSLDIPWWHLILKFSVLAY